MLWLIDIFLVCGGGQTTAQFNILYPGQMFHWMVDGGDCWERRDASDQVSFWSLSSNWSRVSVLVFSAKKRNSPSVGRDRNMLHKHGGEWSRCDLISPVEDTYTTVG